MAPPHDWEKERGCCFGILGEGLRRFSIKSPNNNNTKCLISLPCWEVRLLVRVVVPGSKCPTLFLQSAARMEVTRTGVKAKATAEESHLIREQKWARKNNVNVSFVRLTFTPCYHDTRVRPPPGDRRPPSCTGWSPPCYKAGPSRRVRGDNRPIIGCR